MKERLRSINSIPFLICLALLLLNDFYFKAQFHNELTGKLSDFCGLFVFASFWSAILPTRKLAVYFSTALIFAIWKSPYSQTFIDLFSLTLYSIHRTVDPTDLIALVILPIGFFYSPENRLKLKVNPLPLAALSFIAFCATSIPDASQKFPQPQYILFKSGIVDFSTAVHPSIYNAYQFDSLIVVNVREIRIETHARLNDEFHKKQILTDLDLRLLMESQHRNDMAGSQSHYDELRDSLTIRGNTAITIKLDSVTDVLNFRDTRLDGSFKRLSDNNQLMIEGTFKNGIEDSIWTFYNRSNEVVSRKLFQNGELIRTELFENSNLIGEQDHNTRYDTVRNKYFHIAIVCVFIILLVTKLVLNFRRSEQEDVIKISLFSAIACIIGLPLVVLIVARLISNVIPNSYSAPFFGVFFEGFYIYVITAPLFLLVLGFVKLRSKFDLIMYILIFSLGVILIEEWSYLKVLAP